jgi:D-apionolactonase
MTPSRQQLYDGSATAEPPPVTLRAGPLHLLYANGTLRHIRLGDVPMLHQIYAAVRNENWDTIAGEIHNFYADVGDQSFRIHFDMAHQAAPVDFTWHAEISGEASGAITFTFDGIAHSTFQRNRIGFCVLHPMTLAGQPCVIEHVDSGYRDGYFPDLIAPHQPFFDIRAITHEVVPGVQVRVLLTGDTFEMEDQRNWIDASYKTYCTPLDLPFPVAVQAGERIEQAVTLTLRGASITVNSAEMDTVRIESTDATVSLCPLGLGLPSHRALPTPLEIERLTRLNLAHLRAEVRLYQADAPAQWQYAVEYAAALNVPLELALFVSDNAAAELDQFADYLNAAQPTVARIAVFHQQEKSTRREWVELARQHLAQLNVPIGAGTDAFFTELNRERPPADALDFVTYSINPQVHAFDNLSLVEALAAHVPTIKTARSLAAGKPVVISPITLRMRWNPNATRAPAPTPPDQLPPPVDARQMSLLGAGWTLGSIKYCAETGADALTYYETTGWCGVMETAQGSPLPDQFPSEPGTVFPLYHVLAAVGAFAGGEIVVCRSSDSLKVEALWLRQGSRHRLLVANLTADAQSVTVADANDPVQMRVLDEHTALLALHDPAAFWESDPQRIAAQGEIRLMLDPYAITILDWIDGEG